MEQFSVEAAKARNKKFTPKLVNFGKLILGTNVNLENPKTIQEKLMWLNLYDIDYKKSLCADKIKVHEYCKEKLGEDICIPILKVYDDIESIDWDELPFKFVLKCNHGSGMNCIVSNKSTANKDIILNRLKKWMKDDFSVRNGYESHYYWIDRKIFAEEYKNDGHKDLIDYKFLCFNGEPTFCQIIGGRNESTKHLNYYDMDFNFHDISRTDFRNNKNIIHEKPTNFELMKTYAEKLSEDFKFVRVDFYEIDNKIYLGELTFTPGACVFKYAKDEDNKKMGDLLTL